jgi:MFS transporter, DHA2 family, methylenomycin A resistance protein
MAVAREGLALDSVTESGPKPSSANPFASWIPAVATGAAFFMIVLDTSIVNLALARIGTELNSSLATLQWLVDGYALVFASLLLGAGALGDRFEAKRTFMRGASFRALTSSWAQSAVAHSTNG